MRLDLGVQWPVSGISFSEHIGLHAILWSSNLTRLPHLFQVGNYFITKWASMQRLHSLGQLVVRRRAQDDTVVERRIESGVLRDQARLLVKRVPQEL